MEQKDNVSIKHADYDATATDRETFAAACGGTKALRKSASTLLPRFPMEDAKSYALRTSVSVGLSVTEKTLDTLVGLVFQKPITLGEDVPKEIEDLAENIDNKGNHINVAARELFRSSFDGWAVWLVDAPTGKAADAGQAKAMGLRPYIALYKANDVTNWDWQVNPVSGKVELSLIVLKECQTVRAKGSFKRVEQVFYLACFLDNGVARWNRWREVKDDKTKTVDYELIGEGIFEKQTALPVAIVGMLGDEPPLLDLAFQNIEHSQTRSDAITFARKTRGVIPYSTGISKEDAAQALDSETMWHLPENGTIAFAQADGTIRQEDRILLDEMKAEMAWLGLQMLMPKPKQGGKATATEVVSDTLQDTSALQVRAEQLKDALELAFGFIARYLGLGEDAGGSIDLGCSWQQMVLSPQELQVWNTMASDGNISLETFLYKLERAGQLPPDVTAEDEKKRIEEESKALKPVLNANAMPNNQNADGTPVGVAQ